MIARIPGYRGNPEHVALHWKPEAALWLPVRGDRGAFGEVTAMSAARMCAGALQTQLEPVIAQASELHKLCDRRNRADDLDLARHRINLSREVSQALDVVGVNLERLLDEPTDQDKVRIDAEYERGEPMTADRVFLRCISAAMTYARITTGKSVTRDGLADARYLLDDLLNGNKDALGNENGGYDP